MKWKGHRWYTSRPKVPPRPQRVPHALHKNSNRPHLLHSEPVLVGQNHRNGTSQVELPRRARVARVRRRHQPNQRLLLVRALLRDLLQVLGARQGPRPVHKPRGLVPTQQLRHFGPSHRPHLQRHGPTWTRLARGSHELLRLCLVPHLRGGQTIEHQCRVLVPRARYGRRWCSFHVWARVLL